MFYGIYHRLGGALPGYESKGFYSEDEHRELYGVEEKWSACLTKTHRKVGPSRGIRVDVCKAEQHRFLAYTRAVTKLYIPTCTRDELDYSWSTFVRDNNRSASYLDKLADQLRKDTVGDFSANIFIKGESYGEFKYPRIICALSDATKALFGPITRRVEKCFFDKTRSPLGKFFVKKIPVIDRPAHLECLFGEQSVTVGDFSSFECHHRGPFARALKFAFFKLLGDSLPRNIRYLLSQLLNGHNTLQSKTTGVEACIEDTLMSGAPWTSFMNAMLSMFLLTYARLRQVHPDASSGELAKHVLDVQALFEGDDSIMLGGAYDSAIINRLGIKLKSKTFAHCGLAEFCGILKPQGVEAVLTDPIKVVVKFFELPQQLMNARDSTQGSYFRAKALSYLYQYRTCPVVAHLATAVLQRTRNYSSESKLLSYRRNEVFEEAKSRSFKFMRFEDIRIEQQSRVLVEDRFGLSVSSQLAMEQQFRDYAQGPGTVFDLPPAFDEFVANSLEFVSPEPTRALREWTSNLPNPALMDDSWWHPYSNTRSTKRPVQAHKHVVTKLVDPDE